MTSFPCNPNCVTYPTWTFNTTEHLRVQVSFQEFECRDSKCYIEIGDGSSIGTESRLARFGGRILPSNVTSISNAAWIKLHTSCGKDVLNLHLRAAVVNVSGSY